MGHPSPEQLERELEELRNMCQLKDEKIQKAEDQITALRRELFQQSQSPDPDVADLASRQFAGLEHENSILDRENDELKGRFLRVLSQKNEYKKRYKKAKLLSASVAPPHPSSLQAENQGLRMRIAELTRDLACAIEEKDFANEQLQERAETIKAMRAEAIEKFNILRAKLADERNRCRDADPFQSQVTALRAELADAEAAAAEARAENAKLLETVDALQQSSEEAMAAQIEFVSSLETVLGCSSLSEALQKVRELQARPRTGDASEDLVDALKQILANLSPNALDLPPNSELRQLFAALCNMLTVATDPQATKALVMPHVRVRLPGARLRAKTDRRSLT
jgi:chromosome segregation ATPase